MQSVTPPFCQSTSLLIMLILYREVCWQNSVSLKRS
jgi:hypothetical protein